METTISNVSFSIEMPETFDENNLECLMVLYGESKNWMDCIILLMGNTIYGESDTSVALAPEKA